MAKTEIERLATLEQKVDQGFTDVKSDISEMKETLKGLVKDLDSRYAPKWVGDVVKGLVVLCMVLVFTVFVSNQFGKKDTTQTVTVTTQNPDGSTTTTKRTESVPSSDKSSNSTSSIPSSNTSPQSSPQPGQQQQTTTTTTTPSENKTLPQTIKDLIPFL